MNINKFNRPEFGTLTSITNEETGITLFVGKEVSDIFGHTNLTQAIKSAHLNPDEFKVIDLKKFKDFKNQLTNSKLVGQRSSSITMLTESGMYKLALSSNLEKAKPFRDWIASEVLPSIRKKGYYSIANQTQAIMLHTNVNIQKQNSRDVNAKLIVKGLDAVIQYNRNSCIMHTGKTPHEVKAYGKTIGLKSVERSSAKEVLRHTKPELACSMSFVDSLVKDGYDPKTCTELSLKAAVPLFEGMIELGISPAELNS
jgi:prophage antirepressor-like protein